jgi:hypothetical protein
LFNWVSTLWLVSYYFKLACRSWFLQNSWDNYEPILSFCSHGTQNNNHISGVMVCMLASKSSR